MKITAILMLAACLQVSATGYTQTVSLSVKDAQLETVFREIRKQTGYNFIFTREVISAAIPVNINVQNASLNDVLELCFQNQPLSFSIEDKFVVIKRKILKTSIGIPDDPSIDIQGKVFNNNGEPIAGATVTVKNTKQATATNEQGEFFLPVVDENATLVISSIGHKTTEVKVQGRSSIEIQLEVTVSSLDETVVIAYGTTTRRLNTGSVGRITAKEIETQPVSNPLAALQGRVPGLFVTQMNGLPGSNFSVLIRGKNSIQNGNSPFYIIDGVPFLNDAERVTQRSGLNANSPFNNINVADIESIEILKDADATAIYGSRGANGVVLITTKKGKEGKPKLDLNLSAGWGKVTRTMDYLNTTQYLQMRREAFKNDGITPSVSDAPDLLLWDTTRYVDWKNKMIGNTSNQSNIQLRLSGGSSNIKYNVSANYFKESTVFPGNYYDQKSSISLNLNYTSTNKKLNASFTSVYAINLSDLPAQDLSQFINLPPNMYEPYNADGILNWNEGGFSYGNPFSILLQKNKGRMNRASTNGIINYKISPSFKLSSSIGFNDIDFDEKSQYPIAAQNPDFNPKGSSSFGSNNIKTWIIEPQVEYNQTIGEKINIIGLLGVTWQENERNAYLIRGTGYTNDDLIGSIQSAPNSTSTNSFSQYRYNAVFSRINFNWDNKYLVNLTGRRDGSSRFGAGRRFSNFVAVGLGWIFSQENFFKNVLPIISYGKIRSSYGLSGNDQIGNYQYLDTWTTTQYPYQGSPSLRPTRLLNPNYNWEKNKKIEIGLELGFNRDKIILTLNRFRNRSDNHIIRFNLPTQTGFTEILRNFPGLVQNSGWEFDITTTNIKAKKFEWTSSFNISFNKNLLLEFPGLENSSYSTTFVIGEPLNIIRGYQYLGIDKSTGIYTFKDQNRDGQIDNLDYKVLGTTDPVYYGGFHNELKYGSLELNILIQFIKQKGNHAIYKLQNAVGSFVNQPVAVLDRWQQPGDLSNYERYTQDFINPAYYPATFFISESDAAFVDASFLRLKNIALSYSLPQNIINKIKFQNCKLFLQGQNLITVTNYIGSDPESQNITSLPPLKMITVGVHVTL